MIERYENSSVELDGSVFGSDKYAFSVLVRILKTNARLTLTDGKRIVVCHSADPYPVWVWLPDDADEDELERAYILVRDELGFGSLRFNMKVCHARYFMKRAERDGRKLSNTLSLLSYACDTPIPPKMEAEGFLEIAEEKDLDEVLNFIYHFDGETLVDNVDEQRQRERAESFVTNKHFFFWNDGRERVASCGFHELSDQCTVVSVFTKRDHRRKGYAAALVHRVSTMIKELGKMPTLYTDGDYAASNACYVQIGYRLQCELCTIV